MLVGFGLTACRRVIAPNREVVPAEGVRDKPNAAVCSGLRKDAARKVNAIHRRSIDDGCELSQALEQKAEAIGPTNNFSVQPSC